MDWTATVSIHESASPHLIRERIVAAVRQQRLHPALLYTGLRQTTLWIDLYKAYSPAQTDRTCLEIYENAFQRALQSVTGNVAHVVSFACGDGSKDLLCLQRVRNSNRIPLYTPVDISLEMVLTACRTVSTLRGLQTTPLLCDLRTCSVLPAVLKSFDPAGAERILLFLGTVHNYWPPEILRAIIYPLRSQDQLIISANLAPAENYDAALGEILRQYDNELTRRWLLGALSELGLSGNDGELRFELRPTAAEGLKRIEALFRLTRSKTVRIFDETSALPANDDISVFFSQRFTKAQITRFLTDAGLRIVEQWIGAGGFEGVFLCQRAQ